MINDKFSLSKFQALVLINYFLIISYDGYLF